MYPPPVDHTYTHLRAHNIMQPRHAPNIVHQIPWSTARTLCKIYRPDAVCCQCNIIRIDINACVRAVFHAAARGVTEHDNWAKRKAEKLNTCRVMAVVQRRTRARLQS